MRKIALTIAALIFSLQGMAVTEDHDFEYKLHTADIFPWVDGAKSGFVTDEKGQMATALNELMASSKRYLDIAAYGIHRQQWLFSVLEYLVDEDVRVRAVVDQAHGVHDEWVPENFTYGDTSELPRILSPGYVIPDLGHPLDPRSGSSSIMHNKFVIVDRMNVWLGSTNFSFTGIGAEYNANASLQVRSEQLAKIYASEFYQMWKKLRFSRDKRPRAHRDPIHYADGTEVSVYFSPQDNTLEAAILPFIERSKICLDVGMFYLTDPRVAEALVEAVGRGVEVRVIYDALAAAHPSTLHRYLRSNGVAVRVENWGGKMHMKAAVADGRRTLIGSMNWSMSGSRANDENTLVIRNNKHLAEDMKHYFDKLWVTLDDDVSMTSEPRAEGINSVNSCFDGIDNDHDGKYDEDDTACQR